MKKILLTTTALTMLAGAAAAEISLSGSGRIGVTSTGGTTAVTHRFRVNFNASGETDGGLTFGAYVRANMNGGQGNTSTIVTSAGPDGIMGTLDDVTSTISVPPRAIGAPRLWIGNGTATLTVGNASGAVAQAGKIWGCGIGFTGACNDLASTAWSWASHSSGGAGPSVVRLDFALGSANVSISGGSASGGAANDTEVAVNFAMGAATVGVSYDNGTLGTGGTTLNVAFDAGSANIGVAYARSDNGFSGYNANVKYGMGAGTLYAGAGTQIIGTGGAATATAATWFVSYMQSLGGGATAGVSMRSTGGTLTTDAGVKFSF
ncbi:MAG: porin [Alphaproteobacteria bacterium]|nr:porin [Alphaproteobacteria bacterium]